MLCKPFDVYIAECAEQIKQKRSPSDYPIELDAVIAANCPFELRPETSSAKLRYGALLIHGLLDSPFSFRDLGEELMQSGILARAVLLPGHGTNPTHLLDTNYHEWIDAVHYGINSLRHEVEEVFLIGYSTGATLSIYHALQDSHIKGIVLLAPALKVLPPVSTIVRLPILANFFSREDKWLCQEKEINYAKYESVPFKPVLELGKLINVIQQNTAELNCPVMLAMSMDDETVSAHAALRFFLSKADNNSRTILYATGKNKSYLDPRIEIRNSAYPSLQIQNMSHIALPFAPNNPHYGQKGDYPFHSNPNAKKIIYGAYNRVEMDVFNQLHKFGLIKNRRSMLTYNPDFDYMAKSIVDFIKS